MKRISSLLLVLVLAFTFILTSCGSEADEVCIIDFTDFTVNQIISWSRRQNVGDKFDYYFDYNDTVKAGTFISSSLKVGEVIKDKVEIRVSLGEKITTGYDPNFPYNPASPSNPFGPNPWEDQDVMPYVIGMKVEDAKAAITKKGFTGVISTIPVPSDQKGGTVVDSSPFVGCSLGYTDLVLLYYSEGNNGSVNIKVPYTGEAAAASVYINGEFKSEFSKIIGSKNANKNVITVSGEGEAVVKISVKDLFSDKSDNVTNYYFKVDFTKGTYNETSGTDKL